MMDVKGLVNCLKIRVGQLEERAAIEDMADLGERAWTNYYGWREKVLAGEETSSLRERLKPWVDHKLVDTSVLDELERWVTALYTVRELEELYQRKVAVDSMIDTWKGLDTKSDGEFTKGHQLSQAPSFEPVGILQAKYSLKCIINGSVMEFDFSCQAPDQEVALFEMSEKVEEPENENVKKFRANAGHDAVYLGLGHQYASGSRRSYGELRHFWRYIRPDRY